MICGCKVSVLRKVSLFTGQEEEAVDISDPHTLGALGAALVASFKAPLDPLYPGMRREKRRLAMVSLYQQVSPPPWPQATITIFNAFTGVLADGLPTLAAELRKWIYHHHPAPASTLPSPSPVSPVPSLHRPPYVPRPEDRQIDNDGSRLMLTSPSANVDLG